MIEVEVNSIRVSLMNQQRVLLLKDITAERYLPIWIGQPEAEAITIELHESRQLKRPLTHDLLKSVIEHMSGRVIHILINDMRRDIFYARLVIEVNGDQIEIDSRPSDAIALAVRVKAPIFVAESVMEKSSVEPEEDVDIYAEPEPDPFSRTSSFGMSESSDPLLEDELTTTKEEKVENVDESQLSAFADFLNTLDLDELDESDE